MKKALIVALVATFMGSGSAWARWGHEGYHSRGGPGFDEEEMEERIEDHVDRLDRRLDLTDGQKKKVEKIIREKMEEHRKLAEENRKKMEARRDKFHADIEAVLTDDQVKEYREQCKMRDKKSKKKGDYGKGKKGKKGKRGRK
jgi:Spy/CpxP family protein refolding chaperone